MFHTQIAVNTMNRTLLLGMLMAVMCGCHDDPGSRPGQQKGSEELAGEFKNRFREAAAESIDHIQSFDDQSNQGTERFGKWQKQTYKIHLDDLYFYFPEVTAGGRYTAEVLFKCDMTTGPLCDTKAEAQASESQPPDYPTFSHLYIYTRRDGKWILTEARYQEEWIDDTMSEEEREFKWIDLELDEVFDPLRLDGIDLTKKLQ